MPTFNVKNMTGEEMSDLAEYCANFLKDTVKTDRKLAASLLIIILENHPDLMTLAE